MENSLSIAVCFVSMGGKRVPWGADERAGEMSKLYAMLRRFGPPSCFLSLATDDVHQPLAIRLSYRAGPPGAFPCVDGNIGSVQQLGVQGIELKVAS